MKIAVGYYDITGNYLGKKHPGPNRSFYLAMGTFVRKIAEDEEQTPYQKEISKRSFKYCDLNRMVIDIKKFTRGRLDKSYNFGWDCSKPALLIGDDLSKKKYGYYSRKLKIKKEYIRLR